MLDVTCVDSRCYEALGRSGVSRLDLILKDEILLCPLLVICCAIGGLGPPLVAITFRAIAGMHLSPGVLSFLFAMVCREPLLGYTAQYSSRCCRSAMVCREPLLGYTHPRRAPRDVRAMVCREPLLGYTRRRRRSSRSALWFAGNHCWDTL